MGLRQKSTLYHFILGNPSPVEFENLTTQEPSEHFEPDPLTVSSPHIFQQDELYKKWILLSPREQDVTALTCLRFTNPQIAVHLGLSKETVKTYLQKVLNKFGLQSKADLRVMYANWDFRAWENPTSHR